MKNATDHLLDAIQKHGTPSEVGAFGRYSEHVGYALFGGEDPIIESCEVFKAWVNVSNGSEGGADFSDIILLQGVIQAFILGSTAEEELVCQMPQNSERRFDLSVRDEVSERYDFEGLISQTELDEIIAQNVTLGLDTTDLDLVTLSLHCCNDIVRYKRFTLGYGVAWLTFPGGYRIGFASNSGMITTIDSYQ